MTVERTVRCLMAACALSLVAVWLGKAPVASAAKLQCAQTVTLSSPSARAPSSETAATAPAPGSPSAGNPCWVDTTPYPFGSDGNPVDPTSEACIGTGNSNIGPNAFGPNWSGDFNPQGGGVSNSPPCYEQVTSMTFRAWNRGLAATGIPGGFAGQSTNAFGVWLYNGTSWFPDPTFPGAGVCPGNTVLWAGKLDYWLIPSNGGKTLCRFDGVNLFWQPLTLPAQTLAHLPTNAQGQATGGITAGTCFAWDNCWFFGTDGIEVHWDGQQLTDETPGLGSSPWLQGDFTAAAGVTTPSGANIGLADNSGLMTVQDTSTCSDPIGSQCPVPNAPDGSPSPTAIGSAGSSWSPLAFAPPDQTMVSQIGMDTAGDSAWAVGQPINGQPTTARPAPLIPLAPNGAQVVSCPGYAGDTFTFGGAGAALSGFQWASLGVAPDGSVFAGGLDTTTAANWHSNPAATNDTEPVLVHAACGTAPGQGAAAGSVGSITEFREPDPFDSDQGSAQTQMVPADSGASATITAVAAPATNDVWAAAGFGMWVHPGTGGAGFTVGGPQRPRLYQLTDGQTPDAPAGDDNEPRPSLFTLSPPVFQVETPTVTITPTVKTTTIKQKGKTKRKQLKPAVYGVQTKLQHGGTRRKPTYTLHLTFKLRRPTTVGLEALHGKRVVARAPMRRFTGRTGELSVPLSRKAWPTSLKLTTPKGQEGTGSSAPQHANQK